MILRPYQSRAVDRTIADLAQSPILVAPTGSGKTVMACEIMRRLDGPGLFVAHRRELITQARDRLAAHGIESGVIMAGFKPTDHRIQVASVQTLARRTVPPVSWVIIDECHHATSDGYKFALAMPRIGLTATPFRLDGRGLGEVFGTINVAVWADELFASGDLVKPRIFTADAIDLNKVRTVAGDYEIGGLANVMSKAKLVGDIIDHWKKHADGRKTLVFAVNVEHSITIRDAFRAAGIHAEHVDGTTPREERDRLFSSFTVLTNCNIATEGVDIPSLECLIIARPTKSLCLHIQMFGRVMRSSPGKVDAVILDHAGNTMTHGLSWERLEYSLDGVVKKRCTPSNEWKSCHVCYALVPRTCKVCPSCGATLAVPKEILHVDGTLYEYNKIKHHWNRMLRESPTICRAVLDFQKAYDRLPPVKPDELKRAVYVEAVEIARKRNHQLGSADHAYRAVFGVWPCGQWVGPIRRFFEFEARRA